MQMLRYLPAAVRDSPAEVEVPEVPVAVEVASPVEVVVPHLVALHPVVAVPTAVPVVPLTRETQTLTKAPSMEHFT